MLAINTHFPPEPERKDSFGVGISPSSTLDLLPVPPLPATPSPSPRAIAFSAHHLLQIQGDRALSVGGSALQEEGEVFVGHLGTGDEWTDQPRRTPLDVTLPADAGACVEVAAGDLHSLFLCGGRVWSCGGGWQGPLGHGDEASHACPRPIAGPLATLRVFHIAAGGAHSLAVTEGGALWSWGWGRHGQLGLGDTASRLSPCRVHAPPTVQVAAGRAHSLLLAADGSVHAFGCTTAGQCGRAAPSVGAAVLDPRRVDGLNGVCEVIAWRDSSAAVQGGSLYRWGAVPPSVVGGERTSMPTPTTMCAEGSAAMSAFLAEAGWGAAPALLPPAPL